MKVTIKKSVLVEAVKIVLRQSRQLMLKKDLRFKRSLLPSQTGRQRKQLERQVRGIQRELKRLKKDVNQRANGGLTQGGHLQALMRKVGGNKQRAKQWARRHWNVLNDKAKEALKTFGPAMIPQQKLPSNQRQDLQTPVL